MLEALPPDRCEPLPLLLPDEREPLDDRDAELRPREDAAEDRRLDALALFALVLFALALFELALFGLLRELEALLPFVLPLLLRDELRLLGLEPFELRDVVFLLLCDREPAWAISPP